MFDPVALTEYADPEYSDQEQGIEPTCSADICLTFEATGNNPRHFDRASGRCARCALASMALAFEDSEPRDEDRDAQVNSLTSRLLNSPGAVDALDRLFAEDAASLRALRMGMAAALDGPDFPGHPGHPVTCQRRCCK